MSCDVCNSITYDSTIPGSPETLSIIFDCEVTYDKILYGGGNGKCKHCGQQIEFSFEDFIHAKIFVTKSKKK